MPEPAARAAEGEAIVLIAGPFNHSMASVADRVLRVHHALAWHTTCAEAIRVASERRVEIVLAARALADGDWRFLLNGLAQLRRCPPVVVLAAHPSVHFRDAAARLGAAACIGLGRAS